MAKIGLIRNTLFFFFYLLVNPRLIVPLLKNVYLPVLAQFEWLKDYDISTIIDVGASNGQVTKSLHYLFPKATIYAFEPIKTESDKIARISSKSIIIENVALSNNNKIAKFYRYTFGPMSSILPLSSNYEKRLETKPNFQIITIKTATLDNYFKNIKLKGLIFLKIDTQGTEKLVLEGGKNLLKNVSIIHVETFFTKLYKNQHLFDKVYSDLIGSGFRYAGNINESNFYPMFQLPEVENSIFINKRLKIHE